MQTLVISNGLANHGTRMRRCTARPSLIYRHPLRALPYGLAFVRMLMGGLVGLVVAGVAGNLVFWIGVGVALGIALDTAKSHMPAVTASTGVADHRTS